MLNSKIPGFQILRGDSIVSFNFCDLPSSTEVSQMLQIDKINLFYSKIPRFQDSKIPREDSIVSFNSFDLSDSKEVSNMVESSFSVFLAFKGRTYLALHPEVGVSRRHGRTYRRTSQIYDCIGPMGPFSEKNRVSIIINIK